MNEKNPIIGVIMGSDSDWPTMKKACEILDEFEVPYEKKVVSAHRTPDMMAAYGKKARERGIKIIIAGAGGAAHLPGMTAAHTTLPVIGVPIKTSTLNGIDSLYSIVQMPTGVPVTTVAIGKAGNAALLAIRILSMGNADYREKLDRYHKKMAEASRKKTENLI
jgi:5-(carboxyamino)imidazole ribonucleotide mutase